LSAPAAALWSLIRSAGTGHTGHFVGHVLAESKTGPGNECVPSTSPVHCFGCGAHGDIIDLDLALHGGTKGEAADRLARSNGANCRRETPPTKRPFKPQWIYNPSKQDCELINRACETLSQEPELVSLVHEGLPLDAVRLTARQGHLGFCRDLSFGPEIRGPVLLFMYKHGIKARWAKKVIRWLRGNPNGCCWRQNLLTPATRRVFITEGEMDAINLLSIPDVGRVSESLIVSLSSATVLPDVKPFTGREIIFIPDRDKAGQERAEKFARRFEPEVIKIINLGRLA
jgi:hypothetical protein